MSKDPPTVEMISDGEDLFVVVNGVKVAKRGRPGTPQANTWVSLGPGWTVLDRNYPEEIEVMFEGVRMHHHASFEPSIGALSPSSG
jgi:hypothetical protein